MTTIFLIPVWGWLALTVVFTVGGEFLSKEFALQPTFWMAFLTILSYTIGALAWLPVILLRNRLAEMGAMYLLLVLVGTILVGLVLFKETVNIYEGFGLVLAVVAVILLAF